MSDYENAVEIRGLTKHYDGFTLDNICLTVPKGCIVGFIGQNGAGKTTTIHSMLNIIPIDSGEIKLLIYILGIQIICIETTCRIIGSIVCCLSGYRIDNVLNVGFALSRVEIVIVSDVDSAALYLCSACAEGTENNTRMIGSISGGTLKMREEANTSAEIIETYSKGTLVNIVEDKGIWYYVEVNGRYGYMMSKYLTIDNKV